MILESLLELYRVCCLARRLEDMEQELVKRGEAHFYVSGAGHEAVAALAPALSASDWLHCHYRDRALLLARGVSVRAFLDTLLCKDHAPARGRQMTPFMHDVQRRVLSMVTPVGNNALQSVGAALAIKEAPERPIVVCSLGDGTTQQGEFLEALQEASRESAPVLFVVEDNGWAISTNTRGRTPLWLGARDGNPLLGVAVQKLNGREIHHCLPAFTRIVRQMRADRKPQIVWLDVDRLYSHTNADDHRLYRTADEIERVAREGDPLRNLENHLWREGVSAETLASIREQARSMVEEAAEESQLGSDPIAVVDAKAKISTALTNPASEKDSTGSSKARTIRETLCDVLRGLLAEDARVVLLGQDIEDPKGDVFGVTRGLSTQFPGRVRNAPLAEATILGGAIGRAMVGQRPITFVQFADFLPAAFSQIATELATLHWRTGGEMSAPVIIMAACGGYRPGLGPYHAQTMEATFAHIPGLDVLMPSTASDAAGLLRAAYASARPTLFLYPKSLLNDPDSATTVEPSKHFVPLGVARKPRGGRDLTLVGWGNTVRVCYEVAETLQHSGVEAEVIDLRSLSPWDEECVVASAERTGKLIVVHEDNLSCGLGAEIVARVCELSQAPVACRRVARPDSYVPCNYRNQLEILPSYERVLACAAELMHLDLEWESAPESADDDLMEVAAIGSGPSDETVTLVEWLATPGQEVKQGKAIATIEAAKSVFELAAPADGKLESLVVMGGSTIRVGATLALLRPSAPMQVKKKTASARPVLTRRARPYIFSLPQRTKEAAADFVGISNISAAIGSRIIRNVDLPLSRAMSTGDIERRTGIEQRHWIDADESAVSLAVKACRDLFERERIRLEDIDALICSTTSPDRVSPSMACHIASRLGRERKDVYVQAYDINAACSGYLYALQNAYDLLQSRPTGKVLVVTAEVLSPLVDPADPDTAILFGDATTATLVRGSAHASKSKLHLLRPELSARSEDGTTLSVPLQGYIHMNGRRVFAEAVRAMISSLHRICDREGIRVDDLDLVVPHQANQRIMDAIASRIRPRVYSNIRKMGNTASSSIPLCLSEAMPSFQSGQKIGLCAFGSGFTFGSSILKVA
jgi:2-oxoisovalerate dehydrogenase E1 component